MDVEFPTSPESPMGRCLAGWHRFLSGDRTALPAIVAEDAVFHSPVLYRPQQGRDLVVLYPTGASEAEGAAEGTTSHRPTRTPRAGRGTAGSATSGPWSASTTRSWSSRP
jgi:hypothetical protein